MKLRKISEITATLPFTEFDFMQKYRESFAVSELGRIYAQLPIKELAAEISSRMPAKKPQGNKPLFPPEGEIALMFLKPYTGMSDDGLAAYSPPTHRCDEPRQDTGIPHALQSQNVLLLSAKLLRATEN